MSRRFESERPLRPLRRTHARGSVVRSEATEFAGHLVSRLKDDGYWVRGVDIKDPEFDPSDVLIPL